MMQQQQQQQVQQQVQMPPGAGQVPPQGRMQVMQGGMMGQPVVGNPMQQGPVSRISF